jgi:lipopolysaccharide/colanic/teichoic acid biosynthesis glycosyltransferase
MISTQILQAAPVAVEAPVPAPYPTVWGMDPIQLHDHFWAARGVFVVRLGEQRQIPQDAEMYLLTDARTLAIFRLAQVIDTLSWVKPGVMFLRVVNRQNHDYRETVQLDPQGGFVRFRRLYGGIVPRLARVALTRDPRVAFVWQQSSDSRSAWKRLRREARSYRGEAATIRGRAYDRASDREVMQFVNDLIRSWQQPSATVPGIRKLSGGVWGPEDAKIEKGVRFVGPVWIGAGRNLGAEDTVLGPAVLWDEHGTRRAISEVRWSELEPSEVLAVARKRRPNSRGPWGKRIFDIVFASLVLLFTFPLYPLVMLAIWLEDGSPFFFAHRRETLGGVEFPCIKFRSMRKDAEKIKARLLAENQADGPQFYIAKDPRLTRVGNFIRKLNIDELPQFLNVLLGHMSVVGPRPSPRSENQYSPAWREARLSVRAGVTGLWQVSRTRRPGLDFQEWIKYDLQYVNNANWRLDLWIIFKTLQLLTRG